MVLPSQLWDKAYYHYWLSLAYEQFGQDYDLLPYIHWQQKYAQDSTDVAIQKRLWPKFKPSRTPNRASSRAQSSAIGLMSDKLENPMSATAKQQATIQQATIQQTTGQKLADVKPVSQPSIESTSQVAQTPKAPPPASLSNELTQQLMNDKLRLQTQLSTKDTAKDKKLLVIALGGVLILIILVILVKIMR